jgi:hypothetical protein
LSAIAFEWSAEISNLVPSIIQQLHIKFSASFAKLATQKTTIFDGTITLLHLSIENLKNELTL